MQSEVKFLRDTRNSYVAESQIDGSFILIATNVYFSRIPLPPFLFSDPNYREREFRTRILNFVCERFHAFVEASSLIQSPRFGKCDLHILQD